MAEEAVQAKEKPQLDQTLTVFLLLILAGALSLLGGVFILSGIGWTLVALAVEMFGAAAFLKIGMTTAGPNETA